MDFNTETDQKDQDIVKAEKKRAIRKKNRIPNWIWMGIVAALFLACIFVSCYRLFESRAKAYLVNPVESHENISDLFDNNEVLYHNLYNVLNNTDISYSELYFSLKDDLKSYSGENNVSYEGTDETESYSGNMSETTDDEEAYREERLQYAIAEINNYYNNLETDFTEINSDYDYFIRDNATGAYLTNTAQSSGLNFDTSYFYLTFQYDKNGNVTIGEKLSSENADQVRKTATEAARVKTKKFDIDSYEKLDIRKNSPVDCTITYAISNETWKKLQDTENVIINGYNFWWTQYTGYVNAGVGQIYATLLLIAMILGLFCPGAGKEKPWNLVSICRLPLEVLVIIGMCAVGMGETVITMAIKSGTAVADFSAQMPEKLAAVLIYSGNVLALTALFGIAWYLGICIRSTREHGIWSYIKMRSLTFRFFPYIKNKVLGFYSTMIHFDVTQNAKKHIFKIVLINAVILFVISSLWFGGVAITVIYSVILYFILKKYVSDLQKKYGILLGATNAIAEGNLNVVITEDIGIFEPFKPQISRIQYGFRNAVEEEVKSQRMKAELITNVSHDLKTPLTAIITYIGLLQNENITEEQRKEYLATLEKKSIRLKVLIEDLFEVSKATSRAVTLNIMDVDIMSLVKQVELEMSDKLKDSNLEVKMNLSESRIILPLDSQKTYRIYENLFGNIAKYAMSGTRVYVTGFQIDDMVVISLRNISSAEILVSPQELTDRFVRGDASRNTEGSGLGLAIAKSFTELQNGHLDIEVDGDLFKVTTTWRLPPPEPPQWG